MRTMSRGLSEFQIWVMEKVERRGNVTLRDVYETDLEKGLEGNDKTEIPRGMFGWLWECCRDTLPIKKYRKTMESLQRRGLVAALLHVQPTVWYYVTWAEGKPLIKLDDARTLPLVHARSGQIEYKLKGRIWTVR